MASAFTLVVFRRQSRRLRPPGRRAPTGGGVETACPIVYPVNQREGYTIGHTVSTPPPAGPGGDGQLPVWVKHGAFQINPLSEFQILAELNFQEV